MFLNRSPRCAYRIENQTSRLMPANTAFCIRIYGQSTRVIIGMSGIGGQSNVYLTNTTDNRDEQLSLV